MVFAKFSSYPLPAPTGTEFMAAIFAMRALGEALVAELSPQLASCDTSL